jgi:3-dehydroquinate synthase
MLESFDVTTSGGKYKVNVGENLLESIKPNQHAIFLVDEYFVPQLVFEAKRVIAIPALESSKNLDYMSGVIEKMRMLGGNRDTHVYAIGGGTIQDIATFVNSIYMRGISWTYFPSTLLSMADSCIGGKSSINVKGYKNLVGNIYPPTEVFVDLGFCKTLERKEIIGGLAEAVKICYARGNDVFEKYLELNPHYPLDVKKGVNVLFSALMAKKFFIEIDEFDQSERLLLNYGHTFGHALEASSNFELAHGVAVALGMMVATQYSTLSSLLNEAGENRTKKLDTYLVKLLSPLLGDIRNILVKVDLKLVMAKFESDKKHRHEEYRMVIPAASGNLMLHSCPKNEVSKILIEKAFKKTFVMHGFLDF